LINVGEVETLKVMKFLQGRDLKGASALTEERIAAEFLSFLGEKPLSTESVCAPNTGKASIRANQLQAISPLETRCY